MLPTCIGQWAAGLVNEAQTNAYDGLVDRPAGASVDAVEALWSLAVGK